MKKIITLLSAVLLASGLQAQTDYGTETETNDFRFAIGAHSGSTTGQGFSFRYQPEKFGIQLTGIPIFNGRNNFYSSTGLTLMYTLRKHERLDLFTYLGNHYIYQRYESFPFVDPWPMPSEPVILTERNYNIGLGAGINIHLWQVLDLSLQLGYGVYNVNNSNINSNIAGEIGLYYRF